MTTEPKEALSLTERIVVTVIASALFLGTVAWPVWEAFVR
jgi:hypothetical protein